MNWKTNGLINTLLLFLLVTAVHTVNADIMNIQVKHNRFLDSNGNTLHHFNYKIANNELGFEETKEGFVASLEIKISAEDSEGKKSDIDTFTRYIGAHNREEAASQNLYYLDKITLPPLSKADFKFILIFTDKQSQKSFQWTKNLENLQPDALASDIEFSHQITRGRLRPGMESFQRGNYQFYVDPAQIYQKTVNDTVFFYYEIQNLFPAVDEYSYVVETINISNEQKSYKIENQIRVRGKELDRIHTIVTDTLEAGYYNIELTVTDRVRHRQQTVTDYFVVSERHVVTQRLFADTEKEHQLLRYFLPSTYFRNWSDMSRTAKTNLVDRFWRQNDPNPQSEGNPFLQAIRERVNYANQNFSHFNEGWETDLGRIYIRNGDPDDIEKNYIEGDIRITRREYQIWRYRSLNRVYLFIDIQGTGNYRLIYSRNDDMEHIVHDWQRLVGEDFDMSKLEQ